MENDQTKHEYIENYYIDLIKQNKLLPGEQLPSENEMSNIFDVSRHTVRQALSYLEKEGWIYKIKGMGSFCSNRVEPKKFRKSIVVFITSISEYIFPKIIEGIERELRINNYNMVLINSEDKEENERRFFSDIITDRAAGIIIEPAQSAINTTHNEYIRKLEALGIKVVTINSHFEDIETGYVDVDDFSGGYKLTNHLIKLGHKKIAGVFKTDDIQGVNRKGGCIKALESNNIEIDEDIILEFTTENKNTTYVSDFLYKLLTNKNRPTAIVCYNDEIAIQVIKVCKELNIALGKDLSIVSFDDSEMLSFLDYKITNIPHPKAELGKKAAQFIINMVEGRSCESQYTFKAKIMKGNSCAKIKEGC